MQKKSELDDDIQNFITDCLDDDGNISFNFNKNSGSIANDN